MCRYPRLIKNKRFEPNKKNGGIVPFCEDERTKVVAIGCGQCIDCLKQRANGWRIRLLEEIRNSKKRAYFITFTFSNSSLKELASECDGESNAVAGLAVHRWRKRWWKKFKEYPRYWLITELGHTGTERIHLHGIVWTDRGAETIKERWGYGWTYVGKFVSEKTINYIIKYCTKVDLHHKGYVPKIYCSNGLGAEFIGRTNVNEFRGDKTNESYSLSNGVKLGLPIYYRNKLYNEDERTKLWIKKLDEGIRWIKGNKYYTNTEEGMREFLTVLESAQKDNEALGFGNGSVKRWKRSVYNMTYREMIKDISSVDNSSVIVDNRGFLVDKRGG